MTTTAVAASRPETGASREPGHTSAVACGPMDSVPVLKRSRPFALMQTRKEEEMARPERRYGPASGLTLGGIIVIVGIILIFIWSFWIGLITALVGLLRRFRARQVVLASLRWRSSASLDLLDQPGDWAAASPDVPASVLLSVRAGG